MSFISNAVQLIQKAFFILLLRFFISPKQILPSFIYYNALNAMQNAVAQAVTGINNNNNNSNSNEIYHTLASNFSLASSSVRLFVQLHIS